MFGKLRNSLVSGGSIAFLVFLLWGSIVLLGLFLSVHSRDPGVIEQVLKSRWGENFQQNFLSQGGLLFSAPLQENPAQSPASLYTMGFLQIARLFERVHTWVVGSFSYGLLVFHNQLIPMLSSVLLGFLAMRLTLRVGGRPVHAFVLGLSAQTMYQTFPGNLWFFWEIYPTTPFVLFMALFLVCEDSEYSPNAKRKLTQFIQNVSVFSMVYVEWIGALCFLLSYYLVCRFFTSEKSSIKIEKKKIFLPAFLAFAVMAGQFIWFRISYSEVQLFGGEKGALLGLSQSILQVESLANVLKKRYTSLLPGWNILKTAGFIATFIVLSLVRKNNIHSIHLRMLVACLGFYALFLILNPTFFFLPEAYEVYLAFPLILALFALLPAWLETFNNNSGIFVLLSSVIAFCWTCIQLRNYSIYYPL